MAGLVAPEDEAWRVTNELIASNGTMAGATAAVREALDRKAHYISAKVSPVLESLVELVLADRAANAAASGAEAAGEDAATSAFELLSFMESRVGAVATAEDFAAADDADKDTESGKDEAASSAVAKALPSGVNGVDEEVAVRAITPLMDDILRSVLARCASEEPEDAAAAMRAFFAECRDLAASGDMDALSRHLHFDPRPHAPSKA